MAFEKMFRGTAFICLVLGLLTTHADGGPVFGALCSAGCAGVVVACYSAGGAVFGTVTAGVGTPAAILACNSAFGTCMGNCAVVTASWTP